MLNESLLRVEHQCIMMQVSVHTLQQWPYRICVQIMYSFAVVVSGTRMVIIDISHSDVSETGNVKRNLERPS